RGPARARAAGGGGRPRCGGAAASAAGEVPAAAAAGRGGRGGAGGYGTGVALPGAPWRHGAGQRPAARGGLLMAGPAPSPSWKQRPEGGSPGAIRLILGIARGGGRSLARLCLYQIG